MVQFNREVQHATQSRLPQAFNLPFMESDKYFGQISEDLKQGDQEISSGTTSASLESMFLKDFMMQVQNDECVINPFANR